MARSIASTLRTIPGATAALLLAAHTALAGPVPQEVKEGIRFGRSVLALTDIDGDGTDDFAVGAPSAAVGDRPKAGAVLVLSGRTQQPLARWTSDHAIGFGNSLRRLTDLNGDGAPEVLVGRPGIGPVDVRCGRTGKALFLLDAAARDVLQIGDVSGDGASDFVLAGTRPLALRSGKDGEVLDATIASRSAQGLLPLGDLDGDGFADVALPETNELLLSGQGAEDPQALFAQPYPKKLLGDSEAVLPLEKAVIEGAVGAGVGPGADGARFFLATSDASGERTQLHSVAVGESASVSWTVPGPGRNNPKGSTEFTGFSGQLENVAATLQLAPDMDGDGRADVWVSEPCQMINVAFATYAASSGKVLYRGEWEGAGPDSGLVMDTVRDVDGDGVRDLLVGTSTWVDRGWVSDRGSVRMLSGATGEPLWVLREAGVEATEIFMKKTAWEHRLLVMHGPESLCEEQVQLLASDYHGALDRDIIAIDLNREFAKARIGDLPARPPSAVLKRLYGIEGDGFVMLLVGKDGGLKKRYGEPVPAAEIWKVIDVMPMRREEKRRR